MTDLLNPITDDIIEAGCRAYMKAMHESFNPDTSIFKSGEPNWKLYIGGVRAVLETAFVREAQPAESPLPQKEICIADEQWAIDAFYEGYDKANADFKANGFSGLKPIIGGIRSLLAAVNAPKRKIGADIETLDKAATIGAIERLHREMIQRAEPYQKRLAAFMDSERPAPIVTDNGVFQYTGPLPDAPIVKGYRKTNAKSYNV